MYSQGDIILVPFPFTDLSGSKLRPALVVSNNNINQNRDLVCVQITSKVFTDDLYYKLGKNDISPPLLLESGIRLHKFFTIEQTKVFKLIGKMNTSSLTNIINEIQVKVFL